MNILKATFVAALATSFGFPAAASPAFDAFKKICGDTRADFPAVKAALGGTGWTPTEILPTNMEGVTPTEGIARTSTVGNQRIAIYAWVGPKPPYQLMSCTAHVPSLQQGQATAEVRAWLGVAPETSSSAKATWRYGLTNGAPTAVTSAGFEPAAAGDGLYFLNVLTEGGEVVIDLLKIRHPKAN
ncbi:MAG TPA: hypothetical protein VG227_06155 [Caulobacteraceae bacterium]|nr:hypothetical protein [Caulobacteraceae bacterium]